MRTACAVLWLCAMPLAGCSKDSPTAPTSVTPPVAGSLLPPASSVLAISLIGDMWIPTTSTTVQQTARLVTRTEPFEYTLATDGVTWSIEPAGVALIDQHGRVSPVSIGTATVTARYGDKTGTNPIRVLPDYSGNWSGQFRITGCTGGFDFRECGRMMVGAGAGTGTGTAASPFYPFTMSLSQFRDQVTGTVREARASGDLVYAVTGIVRVAGQLVLEATVPQVGNEPLRVFNWSSTVNAGVTTMSGAFTKIEPYRSFSNTPYTIRTEHEFSGVTHTP
jgi:hypothetical protein